MSSLSSSPLSLLEISYKKSTLRYEDIINLEEDNLERMIYDKIVEKARDKIRKCLKQNQSKLILRSIYLLKTSDINTMSNEILGNLSNYNLSIWRISMVHAVTSYILSSTDRERIIDVFDTADMCLPFRDVDEKRNIIEKLLKIQNYSSGLDNLDNLDTDTDIYLYIDVYTSFGKYILP
jgi:hypothetical protein